MSQRNSGYERKENECYETPEWVTEVLMEHLPRKLQSAWEPACGRGKMATVLKRHIPKVYMSDVALNDADFMLVTPPPQLDAIITNPPFGLAVEFIERALDLMHKRDPGGMVAMLLRTDFDHAASRRHLFAECGAFSRKLVLTRRIRWFEDSIGSPSFNHAWFIWDWSHKGPPTLAYQ